MNVLNDHLLWRYFFLAVMVLHFPHGHALKSDKEQATQLSADQADFNDVTQEYILTGKVVITKGSIVIKGVKAVITIDPEGFQIITIRGDDNRQANFTQQVDKPEPEFVDGQAALIFYAAKNDQLLLSGQAYTVRRKGLRTIDQLVADEINYDLYIERYSAVSKDLLKPTRSVLSPRQTGKTELPNTQK